MILPDIVTPLMSAMQRGTATYHQSKDWLNNNTRSSQERWAPEYSDPNPLNRRSLGQKIHRAIGGYYNYTPPKNKPHYLQDAGLLELVTGGTIPIKPWGRVNIPKKLFGERGFIDPERSNILLKKYLNKFGGVSDRYRYLSEEEINKKISTWRQKRSGIE